jgi:hypothetical protein
LGICPRFSLRKRSASESCLLGYEHRVRDDRRLVVGHQREGLPEARPRGRIAQPLLHHAERVERLVRLRVGLRRLLEELLGLHQIPVGEGLERLLVERRRRAAQRRSGRRVGHGVAGLGWSLMPI